MLDKLSTTVGEFTGDSDYVAALVIFLCTLVLVIWQPGGLGIGFSSLGGALVALFTGVISPTNIPTVFFIVWDATLTFVSLIIISLLLDESGFFHWAAILLAQLAKGHTLILFPLIVLLGAVVSAFFANDGTALILTPIVVKMLQSLQFDKKATRAWVMSVGFIADTASLPLIISNLVNIVSASYFSISFPRYASIMILVDIVTVLASLSVLSIYFFRYLPRYYDITILPKAYSTTLSQLFMVFLFYQGGRGRVINLKKVLFNAPWQIVLFSLGMYLVVFGLRNAGITYQISRLLNKFTPHGLVVTSLGTGFVSAIVSAITNNMPSVLLIALSIHETRSFHGTLTYQAMIYGNIIGCDLGPKFTPIGSLATLLWLHVLSTYGIYISWLEYCQTYILLTIPVLVASTCTLAGWLKVVGISA
ncbi:Arsenical pump membrane protein [Galdieria sulphuraria]|nr:Arsenical pump membrane protein [Galdieria sulphuraria]